VHRHGITGMDERAELLNGHLDIQSEPGVGTQVRPEAILTNLRGVLSSQFSVLGNSGWTGIATHGART
jgi:hypothetical protein